MTITRDPNYPVEAAQLMQAFNMAADGHTLETVLNASLQMVIAAICNVAKQRNVSKQGAVNYAATAVSLIQEGIVENWDREAHPDDLPVKPS